MTRKFRVIAAALFFTCTATAEVAAQCPSLSGFDEFIANSKGVFVGELHGTEDTPEFLGKSRGLTFPNSPPHMKNYEPLGYLVRDLGLLHLNVRARGGTLWACPTREQCGVQTMAVNGPDVEAVSIHLSAADPAFDGYYDVGLTKASPPAKPD